MAALRHSIKNIEDSKSDKSSYIDEIMKVDSTSKSSKRKRRQGATDTPKKLKYL